MRHISAMKTCCISYELLSCVISKQMRLLFEHFIMFRIWNIIKMLKIWNKRKLSKTIATMIKQFSRDWRLDSIGTIMIPWWIRLIQNSCNDIVIGLSTWLTSLLASQNLACSYFFRRKFVGRLIRVCSSWFPCNLLPDWSEHSPRKSTAHCHPSHS